MSAHVRSEQRSTCVNVMAVCGDRSWATGAERGQLKRRHRRAIKSGSAFDQPAGQRHFGPAR